MKIDLTHSEKQFILYTKNHFTKSSNRIDDIERIVAKAFSIPLKGIEMFSVIHFTTQLFDRLMQNGYIPTEGKSPLKYVLDYIYKDNLKRDDETLFYFMFYRIQNTKVEGMNLGDADLTYLEIVK